ncbi:uncharacterized protein LOC111024823 [Momordica charantia]|uniref:Uncharacterized protein LOC111024823 n=1 Tax=Momordica charantia TaxID=3673 RepID=A0A6J1DVR1_MOMCH|nr:uncharacterized protein LOC111024823 [Momordica charantia]
MAIIRTTSVVVVLWVVLAVGICMEKCRCQGLQSEKDASGVTVGHMEAKYRRGKEKVEAFLNVATEIWSKMTPEEREKTLATFAYNEGNEKDIWSSMTPKEREKTQAAYTEAKVKDIWSLLTPEEKEKTQVAFTEGKVKEIWFKMTLEEREKTLTAFKEGKVKEIWSKMTPEERKKTLSSF